MAERDVLVRPGRENRLLVITIVVSIATLLLLSRFRYPAQDRQPPPPAAPLERLAAHATFEELATSIAQLERRLAPALVVLRVTDEQPGNSSSGANAADSRQRFVAAVRTADDQAVASLPAGTHVDGVVGASGFTPAVIAHDRLREIALVRVPAAAGALVLDWSQDAWLTAPTYIVAVEGTPGGPALRPLFLGRSDRVEVERWDQPLLVLGGTTPVQTGAPLVSLEGAFLGLAIRDDRTMGMAPAPLVAVEAERLRSEGSPPTSDAGIELAPLTESLARASGVEQGAVVSYVHPRGPAAGRLFVGDIIEAVADRAVTSDDGGEVQIARTPPGGTLAMRVVRKGRRHAVELVTVDAATPPAHEAADDLGLVLRDARRVGAEILTVLPGSAGARAGLAAGDVITHLDGSAAPSAAQVVRAFTRAKGSAVVVGIRRNRAHLVVALERASGTPPP